MHKRLRCVLRRAVVLIVLGMAAMAQAQVPAPPLVFTTIDGQTLALSELRGKVVLVTFWATTCTICRAEQPELVQTYRQYRPRGLEVIAVAMPYDRLDLMRLHEVPLFHPGLVVAMPYDRLDLMRQHLLQYPMPFPVVWDQDGAIGRRFRDIAGTPTTFIVDKSGRLVSKTTGAIDFQKLHRFLNSSLS